MSRIIKWIRVALTMVGLLALDDLNYLSLDVQRFGQKKKEERKCEPL